MAARDWDAASYHQVSSPMLRMGREVLDRLPLRGDETVLDGGCGTGRITELVCERVPRGRVIGVDLSAEMVAKARDHLGPRADVVRGDLVTFALTRPVDAIISTATFHWILDHDGLFTNLRSLLRPGGRLVAQCGGAGNIARVLTAADAVGATEPFSAHFDGFERPSRFEGAEATAARLEAAGFVDVRCWLEPRPVVPDDPSAYVETVTCGPHLGRLPEALRGRFRDAVVARLPEPVTIDYVRLNIDARSPGPTDR